MKAILCVSAACIAAGALVACGGSSDSSDNTSKGPDVNAKGEGKLNMVMWEGYADPSYVKQFEQQSGCKVNAVPAGSSDEMFTKFRSGGGGL